MINQKELEISNKSYINKDFGSIYSEILEQAQKLSNKYNPETSNESDPFIVALKLLAFIGDKVNYNIDKNVLERFLPSATQISSVRELCEMQGYNIDYYIAPTTEVIVKYVGDVEISDTNFFTLPQFTILQDITGELQFITTQPCTINSKNTYLPAVPVIQGVLKTLSILDSDTIHLENLDANNRIYFPESMVAQNGIFISGGIITAASAESWIRVDNLNTEPANSFVYKFGYDSKKELPYIEFPNDIANLIGDGLTIQYVLTAGASGNVQANTITTLKSPLEFTLSSGETIDLSVADGDLPKLVIKNTNAAINGENPASIDEAYNRFKKTIGTFETLVTCRDYLNYIYNLLDNNGIYPVVSNVQVADRRTDINKATEIMTYGAYGIESTTENSAGTTAFDLCLYPLNPLTSYTDTELYLNSFKPVSSINEIVSKIDENGSIAHDYVQGSGIYAIKNYLFLNAKISTVNKVTSIEAAEIVENVKSALRRDFNARGVDWGEEVPYDALVKSMTEADSRIKYINLFEPTITSKVMTYSGGSVAENEFKITADTTANNVIYTVIAKNVLSGKISLFDFNEDFRYEYGQASLADNKTYTEDVEAISTKTTITIPANSGRPVTLRENETVQFLSPSYITKNTYPYGVKYRLTGATIEPNLITTLQSGQLLELQWTDENGTVQQRFYDADDVIRSTFEIIEKDSFTLISQKDQIEELTINKSRLTVPTYFYWLTNNADNNLVFNEDGEHLLEENEWFFYTTNAFDVLYSFGSGTLLKLGNTSSSVIWTGARPISVDDISENGLLGKRDYFQYQQLDTTTYLDIVEQSIISLVEGDAVYVEDSTITDLSTDLTPVENTIHYHFKNDPDTTWNPLYPVINTEYVTKTRALLNLNVGPQNPQKLLSEQQITLNPGAGQVVIDGADDASTVYFNTLIDHQVAGGDNINVQYTQINTSLVTERKKETIYAYTMNTNNTKHLNAQGYDVLSDDDNGESSFSKTYTLPAIICNATKFTATKYGVISVYINATYTSQFKVVITMGGNTKVKLFNTSNTAGTTLTINSDTEPLEADDKYHLNKLVTLQIIPGDAAVASPTITFATKNSSNSAIKLNGQIQVGKFNLLDVYNTALGLTDVQITGANGLLAKIASLDSNNKFSYVNPIDNSKAIETSNIFDPYAFYDYNNIANKWTISEIDFNAIEAAGSISVTKNSLL